MELIQVSFQLQLVIFYVLYDEQMDFISIINYINEIIQQVPYVYEF
jgi:hypothetical protein